MGMEVSENWGGWCDWFVPDYDCKKVMNDSQVGLGLLSEEFVFSKEMYCEQVFPVCDVYGVPRFPVHEDSFLGDSQRH